MTLKTQLSIINQPPPVKLNDSYNELLSEMDIDIYKILYISIIISYI